MVLSTSFTFAQEVKQMTDNEAYRTVLRSQEMNQMTNGVINPDLIYPGQVLTFLFADGTGARIVAEVGDNQCKIVKNKLAQMELIHGRVIDFPRFDPNAVTPAPAKEKPKFPWGSTVGIILLIFFVAVIYNMFSDSDNKKTTDKNVDPTKEGVPFIANGVKKEDAENHFRTLHNNASNIIVKDIRAGFLNTANGTPQIVDFADGTHKNLCFRNVPGYAGMVSLDGGKTFHEEYFLEGCGNPVHQRKSFKGGLIFSLSPIDFGDEHSEVDSSLAPKADEVVDENVNKTLVQEVVTKEKTNEEPSPAVTKSDLASVSSEHVILVEKFLEKQVAHRVTMKFTNEIGTVETIFETKNETNKK